MFQNDKFCIFTVHSGKLRLNIYLPLDKYKLYYPHVVFATNFLNDTRNTFIMHLHELRDHLLLVQDPGVYLLSSHGYSQDSWLDSFLTFSDAQDLALELLFFYKKNTTSMVINL